MFVKKCAVCGAEFETGKGNTKYCSDACRTAAAKEKRAEWEKKTDYRTKQRRAMELYRAKITEEEDRARRKKERDKRAAQKRKQTKEINARRTAREDAAARGDYLAQMEIAREKYGNTNNFDYWRAFKLYEISFAASWGRESKRTVNGVSVYEEDFEARVMEELTRTGRIVSKLEQ